MKRRCKHDNFLTDIATINFSRTSQVRGMWYVLILPGNYLLVTAENYCC